MPKCTIVHVRDLGDGNTFLTLSTPDGEKITELALTADGPYKRGAQFDPNPGDATPDPESDLREIEALEREIEDLNQDEGELDVNPVQEAPSEFPTLPAPEVGGE